MLILPLAKQVDTVQPIANGTSNPDAIQMFGYQAIHEMTLLGQEFSKSFFGSSSLYTYYQGCSEGGRDGFSQVQRFADCMSPWIEMMILQS